MRKFLLVFGWIIVSLTACQKDQTVAPVETLRDRALREVLRIAREGASMLEDDETTRSAFGRRIDPSGVTCRIVPGTRAGESADTLYYVVNYADEAGFALVAADERMADRLLAVTERGRYAAGERSGNEGFDLYVDLLEHSLKDTVLMRDSTYREPGKWCEIEDYYSSWVAKGPYVTVRWGQGRTPYDPIYPYNKYCYSKYNQLSPAGCSAVVVAQIMSYHKKPGSYKITFDGSNRTKSIDWDALTACVDGWMFYWTEEAAEDIALLFREIGERADIEYAPGGSGTSPQNARHGFAAFGYDQNPARNYTFADVRKDLDAGRPLYMRGEADFVDANGNVNRAGHAWVADGYKFRYHYIHEYKDHDYGREYFRNETIPCQYIHINWGYDGDNNGYFQDNVFDLAKGYEYDMPYYDPTSMHFKYNVWIITQIRNTK